MRRQGLLALTLCVPVALGAQSITQDYNRYSNMLNQERADQQRREQQAQYDKSAKDNHFNGASNSGGGGGSVPVSSGSSTAADLAGAGLNTLNNMNDRMKAHAAERQKQKQEAEAARAKREAENKRDSEAFIASLNSPAGRLEQAKRDLDHGNLDKVMDYVDYLMFGEGRNTAQGLEWAKKAADRGSVDAQERVGSLYMVGWKEVPADTEKARPYLTKCASAGRPKCLTLMAQLNEANPEAARAYARDAYMRGGPSDSMAARTYFQSLRTDMVTDDLRKTAYEVAHQQAEMLKTLPAPAANDPVAKSYQRHRVYLASRAAVMEYLGRGTQQNQPAAIAKLQDLADHYDSPDAANELASLYRDGAEGLPKDDAKSVKYLRQAAVGGNAHALRVMAIREIKGDGLPKNEKEGRELLRLAAANGDADAYYTYGQTLLYGMGGPADRATAIAWFVESAEKLHDQDSAELLKKENVTQAEIQQGRSVKLDLSTEAHL
ncbi:MAG: sel1 repeat family protein [Acidobacteria bacterium]|nr:sel1 repeat family protein [Acidobacteriota bacterium]